MTAGQWYTLVRFHQTPQQLTGVTQARTAQEALLVLDGWNDAFPDDTTVVFDPANHPITREALTGALRGLRSWRP